MFVITGVYRVPSPYILGTVYTEAVSNRHGFMASKPDRKRYGFEVFTRSPSNRFPQSRDCISCTPCEIQ